MPTVQHGTCVWEQTTSNTNIKIFKMQNGKHEGVVSIQKPNMKKPIVMETQEADDLPQARQFAYFIIHEVTEEL